MDQGRKRAGCLEVGGVTGVRDDLGGWRPGCAAATSAARSVPCPSSRPEMTSVGALISARWSCSGVMAPCPAPSRLSGEAMGSVRASLGCQLRPDLRCEPGLAGEDRLGGPVAHEAVEVAALQLVDPAHVRLTADSPALRHPRCPRDGRLEDQSADDRRARRRPGGARHARRGSSRGRARVRHRIRRRITARSAACRSSACRGAGGASESPCPRRSTTIVRWSRASVARCGAQVAPLPVNPCSRSRGCPRSLDADRVADAIGHGQAGHPTASATASCSRRWSTTLRARSVRRRSTRTPGRDTDSATVSPMPPGLELRRRRAEDPGHGQDIDAVGCPEQLLVMLGEADIRPVGRALRQEREDAATIVVDDHDGGRQVVEPSRHQGVEVVHEGDVSDDEQHRSGIGRGRTQGRRDDAVDAVDTPVGDAPHPGVAVRQERVEVTDRHRAADIQQRAVRQASLQLREHAPLERLIDRLDRCADRQVGRGTRIGPGRCPRRAGRAVHPVQADGQRVGEGHRVGVDRWSPGAVSAGSSRRRRRPAAPPGPPPGTPGSPRTWGWHRAARSSPGWWADRNAGDRSRLSGRSTTRDRSCGPSRRLASASATMGAPAASASRAMRRRGTIPVERSDHDERPVAGRDARREPIQVGAARQPDPGTARRVAGRRAIGVGCERAVRQQRRAVGQVDLHRARRAPRSRSPRHEPRHRADGPPRPHPAPGPGSSAYHLHGGPYSRAWSMVWAAPRSRSSGGRSAVSTMSGTRAWYASTTAGAKFTTAVPDVPRTATGRRPALASPRAMNAPARSSRWTITRRPGCARSASAMGIDRDPGQTMASRTPAATSSATNARSGAAGVA